jgi:hypothetical protein
MPIAGLLGKLTIDANMPAPIAPPRQQPATPLAASSTDQLRQQIIGS